MSDVGPLGRAYWQLFRKNLDAMGDQPSNAEMAHLLRILARWRNDVISHTQISNQGNVVQNGPFKGMRFVDRTSEGAVMPRLLGTYEAELHPHLKRFEAAKPFDCIVDVGCADGYYAVGLARRWKLPVFAYDIEAEARRQCAEAAELNGVRGLVTIREEFTPTTFEDFVGRKPLVIMDVEGAELELLRPDLSPALAGMTLIVETHHHPNTVEILTERFSPTHTIQREDIGVKGRGVALPPWLVSQPHLDQVLAIWEWRGIPTPWLIMEPKAAQAPQ